MRAIIATLLSCCPLLSFATTETEYYSFINSLSYSQAAPIEQMIHDLEGAPLKSGSYAFTHNQFEIGFREDNVEFSFFYRYDYYLKFNKDTGQIAYLLRNDLALPKNTHYDIYLRPNHLRAWGLGAAYKYQFNTQLNIKTRLNYLRATHTTDGYLNGQLNTVDDSYQAQLYLNYGYSRDTLLERPEEDSDGHGLSLDIDLSWQLDKISLGFSGRDILSYIQYRDLTYTTAIADTNNIAFDPNGNIDTKPTVSGIERYRDQTQRLAARYTLSGSFQLAPGRALNSEIFAYDRQVFPRLGYQSQWHNTKWQLNYDFRSSAWGINLSGRYLHLALRTDSLDWENANALELQFGVNLKL
ncbi:Uncharacterised protein [Zhongshania aliphaticivorans]|uniref:Uncharacterized protein n=1 Tax=Zhongshania aliphaticivorans TaxID=1470434 RepID=A0A5S9PEY3_9GAMM|nr:hypothetical protein [Zhongshania aliphaticivorans]CAA0102561.1 Uncharacterised protein [Zhongshania aliphaticivorans]CAA0114121.1 Uncharacterised protein [Zhongshania aliphaticivorans]